MNRLILLYISIKYKFVYRLINKNYDDLIDHVIYIYILRIK